MADAAAARASSFYWPLRWVAPERRDAMLTIYHWCKRLDALADTEIDGAPAIFAWRAWLEGGALVALSADDQLMAVRMQRTIAESNIDRRWLLDLIGGLTMDLAGEMRAPAMATLTEYCRRVAGVPGQACLAVLGWRGPEADAFAEAAGIAVQLTNILRDVEADAMLGRLYLPREALDAAGIAAADPAIAIPDPRFGDAWLAVALMAETRYVHADTLLPAARRRDVRPALAMLAVYRALLGRLMSRGWRRGAPLAVVPPWQRWTVAARVMAFGS